MIPSDMNMRKETVKERIARLEVGGYIDSKCSGCKDSYTSIYNGGGIVFGPSHRPSKGCQSGKHPHCTCDMCF